MSLSKLIAHNLYVTTWIFKIDDEFNGWGHASFNIDQVKYFSDLRKTKNKLEITDEVIEVIVSKVQKVLPKKVKIACPHLYQSWNEFIKEFCKVGGVIEAAPVCLSVKIGSPSVSFFIEPSGNILVLGSFDWF